MAVEANAVKVSMQVEPSAESAENYTVWTGWDYDGEPTPGLKNGFGAER